MPGGRPAAGPGQLAKVGYLAQDAPLYAGLPVADHLRLGAHLNPGWDAAGVQFRHRKAIRAGHPDMGTVDGYGCQAIEPVAPPFHHPDRGPAAASSSVTEL